MQNFPMIPKITLRTPADQAKDAKNALQEKSTFFLYYLPSGGTQVHEPSVYKHNRFIVAFYGDAKIKFGIRKRLK